MGHYLKIVTILEFVLLKSALFVIGLYQNIAVFLVDKIIIETVFLALLKTLKFNLNLRFLFVSLV